MIRLVLLALMITFCGGGALVAAIKSGHHARASALGLALEVWQEVDTTTGDITIQSALYQSASGWGSKTLASGSVSVSDFPVVAINSSGNACLLWSSFNPSTGLRTLYVNTFSISGGWGTPVQLSVTNDTVRDVYEISIDDNNLAVATWSEFSPQPFLFAATATFGGSWTTHQLSP